MLETIATWAIVVVATPIILMEPWRIPRALSVVVTTALLLVLGLVPLARASRAVVGAWDLYLFLAGMMLLAEIARGHGVFEWLARRAAALARGSALRLFGLIYLVGVVVTVLLSNDATAIVLTPAVAAVADAMQIERPLPYFYICAFVANAASFVLPISNPANLVVYGPNLPSLPDWLGRFGVASVIAIVATFLALVVTQHHALVPARRSPAPTPLSATGRLAAAGLVVTAVAMIAASALQLPLGVVTIIASGVIALAIELRAPRSARVALRGVSWSMVILVAGLFVFVAAIEETGAIAVLAQALERTTSPTLAGTVVAISTNLTNNLPAGLVASNTLALAHVPHAISDAVLVGIDLGPNLSIGGSLATMLWLREVKRHGQRVAAHEFIALGIVVTIPALLAALVVL